MGVSHLGGERGGIFWFLTKRNVLRILAAYVGPVSMMLNFVIAGIILEPLWEIAWVEFAVSRTTVRRCMIFSSLPEPLRDIVYVRTYSTPASLPAFYSFGFQMILDCYILRKRILDCFGSAAVSLTREDWVSGKNNLKLKWFSIVFSCEKGFSIVFGPPPAGVCSPQWECSGVGASCRLIVLWFALLCIDLFCNVLLCSTLLCSTLLCFACRCFCCFVWFLFCFVFLFRSLATPAIESYDNPCEPLGLSTLGTASLNFQSR